MKTPIINLVINNKQILPIQPGVKGLTVVVHQQGIKVDAPEFLEINSETTLECMRTMKQKAWTHISTGHLFKDLFETAMPFSEFNVKLPDQISDLLIMDKGIVHLCGLIVCGCEAAFYRRNPFFRTPEDHLHPKTQRYLMGMINKIKDLAEQMRAEYEETQKRAGVST